MKEAQAYAKWDPQGASSAYISKKGGFQVFNEKGRVDKKGRSSISGCFEFF